MATQILRTQDASRLALPRKAVKKATGMFDEQIGQLMANLCA